MNKRKQFLFVILALLLGIFAPACSTATEQAGNLAEKILITITPFRTLEAAATPTPTTTPTPTITITTEKVQPPPPGIVFLTDEGVFITQSEGDPKLLYTPEETGAYSSVSPDQSFALEYGSYDQNLVNLQDNSRVQVWPYEGLNLCPFNWVGGQSSVLITVLLPPDGDPGYSCNLGSPVLLSAENLELTLLDESASGISGPAVSPDGQMIAYDLGGVPWLYQFESGQRQLDLSKFAVDSLQTALFGDPAWSDSGRLLAWTFRIEVDNSLQGIVVFDFDENAARLFTPYEVGGMENFRPRIYFSPSERYVILDHYQHSNSDFASQIISIDGQLSRQMDGYFSSWSPKNDWFFFERKPGQEPCRLAVESTDGSISLPICRGDQAQWSPDGSQLLSYPYNRDQFWLTDLQEQNTVQVNLPVGAQILRWEATP